MNTGYKSKTLAALLAFALGSVGAHRFYLYGKKDFWGWIYVGFFLIWLLLFLSWDWKQVFMLAPSTYAGFLEALVIGVTPDERWNIQHNAQSARKSDSRWPLALLLVITLGTAATAVIATLARGFDLLFTGGAYG